MGVRSWNVKEQFCFPESFGMPIGVKSLQVTPQYFHRQFDNTMEVQGIYHITCHVEFDKEEAVNYVPEHYTPIEDLDVQGEWGYFEYAVPMTEIIDDLIQPDSEPLVSVKEIDSNTENNGLEISWSVNLEYETSKTMESSGKPAFFESSSSSVEIFESINQPTYEVIPEAPPEMPMEKPAEKQVEESKIKVSETKLESPSFMDSGLEFIHSLEDGYSKVVFVSNKVFGE